MTFVVDASVACKWFFGEPLAAEAWFDSFAPSATLHEEAFAALDAARGTQASMSRSTASNSALTRMLSRRTRREDARSRSVRMRACWSRSARSSTRLSEADSGER